MAAGVCVSFFIGGFGSLGEECNQEQMSPNEHVKTIKPHNQPGSAMNGESRVMSEDINMDRTSVSS